MLAHVHFNILKYPEYQSMDIFENNLKAETLVGSYAEESVKQKTTIPKHSTNWNFYDINNNT